MLREQMTEQTNDYELVINNRKISEAEYYAWLTGIGLDDVEPYEIALVLKFCPDSDKARAFIIARRKHLDPKYEEPSDDTTPDPTRG